MRFLFILICLFLFSSLAFAQGETKVRYLGKLNFNLDPNLVLSAQEEEGKFTYTLIDQSNPETPIFSFLLYSNTFENFKAAIKSKINDESKVPEEGELEKYFFHFSNQNSFLIDNSPGGEAMKMDFSDSVTVYSFKHSNFRIIKNEDLAELLMELFETPIESDTLKERKFDYNFYTEINKENEDSNALKGANVFNRAFSTSLKKIENFKPKSLQNEELFKEIHYRMYLYLVGSIEEKVEQNGKELNGLSSIQEEIRLLQRALISFKNDSLTTANSVLQAQSEIENTKAAITNLNSELSKKFIFTTPLKRSLEEDSILRDSLQSFHSRIIRIDSLISNLAIDRRLETERRPIILDTLFRDSLGNFSLDTLKFGSILRDDLLKIQNIAALQNSLSQSQIKNLRLNEQLDLSKKRLQIFSDSLKDMRNGLRKKSTVYIDNQKSILSQIREQLEKLEFSNKFQFIPNYLELEINRGYIENIILIGEASIFIEPELAKYSLDLPFESVSLKFINDYPIGISSKRDIERLGEYKLISRFRDGEHVEMRLGDLIEKTTQILELDRTDYSPKSGKYEIDLLNVKTKSFPKPDIKEILEFQVYSDFIGVKQQNPNGLIQIEVDREIPLVTNRITKPYVWVPFRSLVNRGANVGFFNFFRPRFIFSKIEENNRSLSLEQVLDNSSVSSQTSDTIKYVTSTLEVKRFERYSIGADLNLLLYNIPNAKSTILINSGFHFGRTDLDSIPSYNSFRNHTNTFQPSLEGIWRFVGDERYGFEVSYAINWLISDEISFSQVGNSLDINSNTELSALEENNKIQRATLLAYLNLDSSNSGRLFFRYRFNSELGNFENNFSQLQLGYTSYLTRRASD